LYSHCTNAAAKDMVCAVGNKHEYFASAEYNSTPNVQIPDTITTSHVRNNPSFQTTVTNTGAEGESLRYSGFRGDSVVQVLLNFDRRHIYERDIEVRSPFCYSKGPDK
jgi:hypothetical protein